MLAMSPLGISDKKLLAAELPLLVCVKALTDFCAEDADVVFGVPEESLLEIGLPYRLQ